MNIRERTEILENDWLSPFAARSQESIGRDKYEPECDLRTVYQRDRDRILHCKAFRRMKHKTQVFLAPEGDHYRTRLTHTLEVAQISRTIARALKMNEDLTEAIALGHDLGHTPFGHCGERTLNQICEGGFDHAEQSVRVVEKLENGGNGLNLTWEVRDGMRNHSTSRMPSTMEGQIVRICDKIAYINHDIDDAIRAGILTEEMLPAEFTEVLGKSVHDRLDNLVRSVISGSYDCSAITMDEDMESAMYGLRQFMFQHVYTDSIAKTEEGKAADVIKRLFDHYYEHVESLPEDYINMIWIGGEPLERVVCDYVSGMSDDFAIHCYNELFVPKSWKY